MTKEEINKEFKEWWKKDGHKFKPETDEEADMCIDIRCWAWKGYLAGRTMNDTPLSISTGIAPPPSDTKST
ncbi:MAG TPA: hypothetical protein ENH85_00375 [Candidatus Scalindua sp.]|nr:hypothetical protein [Candidatus Scalindua sp.]